jgi:hypothetical protein
MGNHRSKTANIRGFYLAHNTLLSASQAYSLLIDYGQAQLANVGLNMAPINRVT